VLHVSPLWTLQRLCFGPDVAAADADRGENRDPGTATPAAASKKQLTREARLENGPEMARLVCPLTAAPRVASSFRSVGNGK